MCLVRSKVGVEGFSRIGRGKEFSKVTIGTAGRIIYDPPFAIETQTCRAKREVYSEDVLLKVRQKSPAIPQIYLD
jgi:hypothetical protein